MAKVIPTTQAPAAAKPAAPAAAPVAGAPAAPAKPEKPPKEKVARVPYPPLGKENAKSKAKTPLTMDFVTAGFKVGDVTWNRRVHGDLKRQDFDSDKAYFTFEQVRSQQRADHWKKRIDECDKLGSIKDVKTAKKLARVRESLAALQATLLAQGVSQSEIDAIMNPAPAAAS